MTVAAVVLAAGEASRFGAPKQRVLLPAVLERLAESAPVAEVVVVEGAHALGCPRNTVLQGIDVRTVRCDDWSRGPGASLRCGLLMLGEDVEAAVVVLADGPDLAPAAIERVFAEWRSHTDPIVAASYGGVRGHPLVLGREEWSRVPDEGLRDLPVRLVPCDDLGAPGDVDTPEQLPERLRDGS